MSISNYPSGFRGGALVKNVPLFDAIDGNVFWVDSGTGGAGNPGSFNRPLDTIENAMSKCTANNGDTIFCKSGHTEAVTAAGGVTCDVAGVRIVGVGHGADQAQIRFTTAAGADLLVSAASVRFENMRFTAAFANVTAAIDIDANDAQFIGCRFDEEATDENYVVVMNVADGVDNLKVIDCDYIGNNASNDHFIELAGTHENVQIVGNRMSHLTAQTATVAMIESATQQINMTLEGNRFHTESAAVAAAFVVLTGTTNNGTASHNYMSSIDADATAANFAAAFDITGLGAFENYAVADTDALAVNTFLTAEDLT